MNTLTSRIHTQLKRFHGNQDGAIALLCLAGLLIIFMSTMMMWDAGKGARDKIEVQKGADAAALSQATVKARSMNMIAYTNIQKRILYGYNTLYIAAFLALVEASAYYMAVAGIKAAKAVKTLPACVTIVGCAIPIANAYQAIVNAIEGLKGVVQLMLEVVEFIAINGGRLYGLGAGGDEVGRSIREVAALDYYQGYMKKIAPWWGWGEAVTRGMRNGATLVGTAPIPEGDATRLREKVRFGLNAINGIFGDTVPAPDDIFRMTNEKDSLPIEQIPDAASFGPLGSIGVPKFVSHAKLCGGMLTSPEFWLVQYYHDHWRNGKSEGYWRDSSAPSGAKIAPQTLVTTLEIMNLPLGCVVSGLTLGHEVLPYEIKVSVSTNPISGILGSETPDKWLRATQNVVVGYKHGDGRNANDGGRQKLQFMEQDYSMGARKVLFSNEGYWTISKSEMVFDKGIAGSLAANMSGINQIPLAGQIFGYLANLLNEPNMWEPHWTSRLRPLALPNETESLDDLDKIYHDALAFMIPLAPLAYLYGEGASFPDLNSMTNLSGQLGQGLNYLTGMANDAFYMERATDPYTVDKQHDGFEK